MSLQLEVGKFYKDNGGMVFKIIHALDDCYIGVNKNNTMCNRYCPNGEYLDNFCRNKALIEEVSELELLSLEGLLKKYFTYNDMVVKIVNIFHSIGKDKVDLEYVLNNGLRIKNLDNLEEIEVKELRVNDDSVFEFNGIKHVCVNARIYTLMYNNELIRLKESIDGIRFMRGEWVKIIIK